MMVFFHFKIILNLPNSTVSLIEFNDQTRNRLVYMNLIGFGLHLN